MMTIKIHRKLDPTINLMFGHWMTLDRHTEKNKKESSMKNRRRKRDLLLELE